MDTQSLWICITIYHWNTKKCIHIYKYKVFLWEKIYITTHTLGKLVPPLALILGGWRGKRVQATGIAYLKSRISNQIEKEI